MKKILILFAAVLIGLTASAQGRGGQRGQRGGDPRQGIQRMAEHLAKEMKLTGDTKEWFIPLYVEYRDTLMALQRSQRMEDKVLEGMDDAAVSALIEESLERDAQSIAVKRAYLAKFRTRLSEKQVYRVMVMGMRPRGGDRQRQNSDGQGGPGEGFQGGFPGGFPGGGPDF